MKRDPAKRRYRHHWEKAISALERAARGRDRGPALLEAARARYALYRFSQVDSDRSRALALAAKAEKAGAREGGALRLAIRQEMGEPEREPSPRPRPPAPATIAKRNSPVPPARAGEVAGARSPVVAERPSRAPPAETRPKAVGVVESKPKALAAAVDKPAEVAALTPPRSRTPAAPDPGKTVPAPAAPASRAARPGASDEEASIDAILARALAGEGGAPAAETQERAVVGEVKSWPNHDYTRVAIYLSRNVSFERVELPADTGAPRRVGLDLRPARLDAGIVHPVGDALVQRVRAIQLDPDTVRVTLDLSGREELAVFPLEDPARLIVDVGAAPAPAMARRLPDRDGEAAALPGTPPSSTPAPHAGTPAVLPPSDDIAVRGAIRRVIVDAGHGGHDTGAIGPTNVREKDVTLAMARRVAKRLRARGFEVVLTRDDDRFLALEERTAIANARHGDLFLSLHANAHPSRDRRGVETYILNVADDRYAARLAARENGAFEEGAADIPLLRRILSDLDAKVSVESSRRIASAVQRELCAGIRVRFGDVRDLGVKSALFYVLLGARMPAVLVETAFISNRAEEKRLASPAFQDEVAAAIVRAVEQVGTGEARIAAAR